jgi:hypothetical protein
MKLQEFIANTIQEYLNEQNKLPLAPNGNPSNLSLPQYNIVRTTEFKNWFGDWENNPNNASKMIDDNGEPLICYHGTDTKFDVFDTKYQKDGWLGRGFYFTDDKKLTKDYGKINLSVFLNIKNPFIVKGNSPSDIIWEINTQYNPSNMQNSDVSQTLKMHNHDGIFFKHWDKGNMFSCFYSNQIKHIKDFK